MASEEEKRELGVKKPPTKNLPEQERRELDQKARQGETVVPGGTGGKSLEAQEHLLKAEAKEVVREVRQMTRTKKHTVFVQAAEIRW